MHASVRGAAVEIPPLLYWITNECKLSFIWTFSGGQFDWGGRLLKSNGGLQRLAQNGWKSFVEYKGISQLNCETNKSSRDESRS